MVETSACGLGVRSIAAGVEARVSEIAQRFRLDVLEVTLDSYAFREL